MGKIWVWIARGESALGWIPDRTTGNLMRLMGYYSIILYAVLLFCHAVFRGGFTFRSLLGLASMAAVASMMAGIGFWIKRKLFFAFYSLGLASGAVYMLVVTIFNTAPGWGDTASLLGFMSVVFLGMLTGVGMEYAKYLLKPKSVQDNNSD